MNKTLFLLRGLPGSGKTTTANLLSENGKYPVLSADMYFEDSEGNYNWNPSKLKDAHTWCKKEVENIILSETDMINGGDCFVKWGKRHISNDKIFVANTFTQEWEIEDYFTLAKQYGYQVVSLIVENRHGNKNVHNVPDEKIEQMKERFQIKL